MRKGNLTLVAVCATLLWAGAAYSAPPTSHRGHKITKTLTFAMPACPIPAATVSPTKSEFTLPRKSPLRHPVSVAGSIQVTDQTSSTIYLIDIAADADLTGITFSRTVKTLQHATAEVAFDKGCTKTDPYGSNDCTWNWDQTITAAYQGALQEDVTAGKLIVDLTVDNIIPFQFACPVCGADCSITLPAGIDRGRWEKIWRLMIRLIRLPLGPTTP